MTDDKDEFQKKLKLFLEHMDAAQRSAEALKDIRDRLLPKYPFTAAQIDSLDSETGILTFALFKKYEQIIVLLNDNILKNIPYFEMENLSKMTRYDFIVYAEKLGIVKAAKPFVDAVALRNQLAHEYPLNAEKQATLINNVIVETEILIDAMASLRRFVDARAPVWSGIRGKAT